MRLDGLLRVLAGTAPAERCLRRAAPKQRPGCATAVERVRADELRLERVPCRLRAGRVVVQGCMPCVVRMSGWRTGGRRGVAVVHGPRNARGKRKVLPRRLDEERLLEDGLALLVPLGLLVRALLSRRRVRAGQARWCQRVGRVMSFARSRKERGIASGNEHAHTSSPWSGRTSRS